MTVSLCSIYIASHLKLCPISKNLPETAIDERDWSADVKCAVALDGWALFGFMTPLAPFTNMV